MRSLYIDPYVVLRYTRTPTARMSLNSASGGTTIENWDDTPLNKTRMVSANETPGPPPHHGRALEPTLNHGTSLHHHRFRCVCLSLATCCIPCPALAPPGGSILDYAWQSQERSPHAPPWGNSRPSTASRTSGSGSFWSTQTAMRGKQRVPAPHCPARRPSTHRCRRCRSRPCPCLRRGWGAGVGRVVRLGGGRRGAGGRGEGGARVRGGGTCAVGVVVAALGVVVAVEAVALAAQRQPHRGGGGTTIVLGQASRARAQVLGHGSWLALHAHHFDVTVDDADYDVLRARYPVVIRLGAGPV